MVCGAWLFAVKHLLAGAAAAALLLLHFLFCGCLASLSLSLSVFSRYFSTIHARAAAFQTKSSKCQLHSKMLTLPPVVPSISSTPAGQNYIYDIIYIYIYKYMYVYIYDIRYICGHT